MKLPAKVRSLENVDPDGRRLHLAIGMFDGVHLGHRSVIEAAVHSARRRKEVAGVLTFWPHPSALFRPDNPTRLIMDPPGKARLFFSLGTDLVIEQPFDTGFAAIPAEDFLGHLRERLPGLTSIYVGENWRFGRGRKGDVPFLIEDSRRFGVNVVSMPRLHYNGEPISSSRIRGALVRGDIEEANVLLGYNYFVEGEVRGGRRLGTDLGFPTLNIPWSGDLRPHYGVYGVRVSRAAGENAADPAFPPRESGLPGVANFGVRPTVDADGDEGPVLEVHLLVDSCPFDRGDRLFVEWVFFLRPEIRFDGLDALRERMERDCDEARRRFEAVS